MKFIFEGLGWLFDIEPARSSKCHECDEPLDHQGFWARLLWPERRLKHTCLGCYKSYPHQIVVEDEGLFEDKEDE